MALVKCKECGHEISNTAKRCPHCGCETAHLQSYKKELAEKIVYVISGALAIIGAVLWLLSAAEMMDLSWWNIFAVFGYAVYEEIPFGVFMEYMMGLSMIISSVIITTRLKRKKGTMGWKSGFSRGVVQKNERMDTDPQDRKVL